MPLTTLDPVTALIVVDLQKGVTALPTVATPMTEVVKNAVALTKAFRKHKLPVVLVNAAGVAPGRAEQSRKLDNVPPEWFELIPELDKQPDDHLVTKRTWGAFSNTDLAAWLKSKNVTQVVVCGVATSIGAESTARQAHELGLNITLAIDAMTDMSAEAHTNSITRIFPRLGETGTSQQVIDLLNARG
ncbi:MAG TPA: isochorismatase family cysteine hydrolase [Hyphomonadaceae bacterium]|nr:isochorismatase family cysteine hydrolase [Hyphomonadaceae bacterium]